MIPTLRFHAKCYVLFPKSQLESLPYSIPFLKLASSWLAVFSPILVGEFTKRRLSLVEPSPDELDLP